MSGNHPNFLAAAVARRTLPGCCQHCGGPHPDKGPGALKCPKCKALLAEWKRKRRGTPKAPIFDAGVMTLAVMQELRAARAEMATMRRKLAKLTTRDYEHTRDRIRREERARVAQAARKSKKSAGAEWDSWQQPFGFEEQKNQCHRLAMACEGAGQ